MIEKWLYGILTGSAMVALATNSFKAESAGVQGPGFTLGMLLFLGLGLVGLGKWGRKKVRRGTSFRGRYLALGLRKVNYRGTSLFYEKEERGKMKQFMMVLTVLFVFRVSAFAQVSTGQGGGMMGGGWGWGMNSGWFVLIIIAIVVIFGIVYMMKRK